MIEIDSEVFADKKEAETWMNVMLEMKYGYSRNKIINLSFKNKESLYKRAKRKVKK